MECRYCFQICSKYGLKNHEIYCMLNPERKSKKGNNNPNFGKKGSNQFVKTKEDGLTIGMPNETRIKISQSHKGKKWSIERREQHKKTMQNVVKEHAESYSSANVNGRVKKIKYKDVILDGGWELIFVKWMDINSIKWIKNHIGFPYQWKEDMKTYYPDFYLPDYNLYIEVKGFIREKDYAKWKVVKNLFIIDNNSIKNIKQGTFILPIDFQNT